MTSEELEKEVPRRRVALETAKIVGRGTWSRLKDLALVVSILAVSFGFVAAGVWALDQYADDVAKFAVDGALAIWGITVVRWVARAALYIVALWAWANILYAVYKPLKNRWDRAENRLKESESNA